MKKYLLTLLFITSTMTVFGDGSFPTIPLTDVPRRVSWELYYHHANGDVTKGKYYLKEGETMVGEIAYASVVTEEAGTLLARQDGDKVLLRVEDRESMVLDFGLSEGEHFTGMDGVEYVVEETGTFDDELIWRLNPDKDRPRCLRLKALKGDGEDVWIEGVGSVNWGIIPLSVLAATGEAESAPDRSRVVYAPNAKYTAKFQVNEEDYKIVYFDAGDNGSGEMPYAEYSFEGNVLCVKGLFMLNKNNCYAECFIQGNEVNLNMDDTSLASGKIPRYVEIRFSGFKPGTYEVGLSGKEHLTLVCSGTDGIGNVNLEEKGAKTDKTFYDLSGRRVSEPQKGIYIQNGRKRAK